MQTEQTTILAARETANGTISQAQAALVKSAAEIAEQYGVPDGINGLTAAEFLGRLSFVVSMSRELRNAGVEHLAHQSIKAQFKQPGGPVDKPDDADKGEPAALPDDPDQAPGLEADVSELALHTNVVKALKQAGIHQVGDLDKFTDEALLKVRGIAPPSLDKIRAAVAEYRVKASS